LTMCAASSTLIPRGVAIRSRMARSARLLSSLIAPPWKNSGLI
jgi:hypothetical protein